MRVTKEQFAESRERILSVAGESFRERGFDGIGIADIMKAAGFTHGGFYRHFASKEDLLAQTSRAVLTRDAERWEQIAERDASASLAIIVQQYLSRLHLEHPEHGCALAALGADASRQPAPVRSAFESGLQSMLRVLTGIIPGASRAARRRRSITTMSALVGAMVLARAVENRALADEILNAVSRDIRSRDEGPELR